MHVIHIDIECIQAFASKMNGNDFAITGRNDDTRACACVLHIHLSSPTDGDIATITGIFLISCPLERCPNFSNTSGFQKVRILEEIEQGRGFRVQPCAGIGFYTQ